MEKILSITRESAMNFNSADFKMFHKNIRASKTYVDIVSTEHALANWPGLSTNERKKLIELVEVRKSVIQKKAR